MAGVKFAIDDFGTGHSSLGNLRRLPITAFKIDRSFIEELSTCREARDIVATIIAMAQTLSLSVVAEGVETEEQAAHLHSSGAEIMQGFLFSQAVPGDVVQNCGWRLFSFDKTRSPAKDRPSPSWWP